MSDAGDDGSGRPARRPRRRPAAKRRFPAWLAVPVAAFGGFVASGWVGAVFGAVAGVFLWLGQERR